jgi:uncharacterized protein YjbI with pentapeptide repeats/sugar lactone lactonase YvrE
MSYRPYIRPRSKASSPCFSEEQNKKLIKKHRHSRWIKYGLQCSIPLTIAIFTIVIYIQDSKIAELARKKDWDIASTGLDIANKTHLQDREIANLTHLHDRELVVEQREEDRQQRADIHYQELYSKYIDDISTVLYKYNQTMFVSEEKKFLYIRRKTIFTLREIDSERRSQLFIFLYENNLLPDRKKTNSTISLDGADLHDIKIQSPLNEKYIFNRLSLGSVNLMNATFTDCIFAGGAHFIGSSMSNISFIDTKFECEDKMTSNNIFDRVRLDYSNFKKTTLCSTRFRLANLSYSNFVDVDMDQVSFIKTDLSYANLSLTHEGILPLNNVILPNGTLYPSDNIENISNCARWSENGITIAGNEKGSVGLSKPLGIFIDTTDNNTLYVADSGNKRVIKFNQNLFKGKSILQDQIFLDYVNLDEEQNLYVNNYSKILKFTPDSLVGIMVARADEPGEELNQLHNVSGFILDEKKNLYISDGSNGRVFKWEPNAKSGFLLADSTDQNTNDSVKLVYPSGIYVDLLNDFLYISDQHDNLIHRFHPIENLTSEVVAGNGESNNSLHHLNGPTTIIVVNSKDIYICDAGNNRIVRWTIGNYSAGGTCIVGCSGRSGKNANMLEQPQDFKFDSNGNLIVSDTGNNRIQKFDLAQNKC